MTYQDQIKSPKWQKKRLEVLNLRGFKCELCNDEDSQLHVHHRFYIKGRKIHEYDNDVFQVLCEKCHGKEHLKTNINTSNNELSELFINMFYFDRDTLLDVLKYTNKKYSQSRFFSIIWLLIHDDKFEEMVEILISLRNKYNEHI